MLHTHTPALDWLHYIYLWIRLLSWLTTDLERWKSIVIFEFDELISDCVDFDNNQGKRTGRASSRALFLSICLCFVKLSLEVRPSLSLSLSRN